MRSRQRIPDVLRNLVNTLRWFAHYTTDDT